MVFCIGTEKGGTGKTTLAIHLATQFALEGADVLLVDTDQQMTASHWCSLRQDAGHQPPISVIQKRGKNIGPDLAGLANRYQHLVIDAGGRESPELLAALVVADVLIIPTEPAQYSLWAIELMSQRVGQARMLNPSLDPWVVLNRAPTHPLRSDVDQTRLALAEAANELRLATTVIKTRSAIVDACNSGLTVMELCAAREPARQEIEGLFKEVRDGR